MKSIFENVQISEKIFQLSSELGKGRAVLVLEKLASMNFQSHSIKFMLGEYGVVDT
ncbi:MAG: hypothetical protein ISR58_20385 [Anaerolineales bacterium]|nr:hypothetical protein [Anaerolineales bacterium]